MSWDKQRPIYGRLPIESGNWQGNRVVDWLTSFWDELLAQTKKELDTPTDWLGRSGQINAYFLDWVGIGMCGYGRVWDSQYTDQQKRDLIRVYGQAYNRVSSVGLTALVGAILPGSYVQDNKPARADYASASVSTVADPLETAYQINVGSDAIRGSRVWKQLERVLSEWSPIGDTRVQYSRLMADLSIVGDSLTVEQSIGYITQ